MCFLYYAIYVVHPVWHAKCPCIPHSFTFDIKTTTHSLLSNVCGSILCRWMYKGASPLFIFHVHHIYLGAQWTFFPDNFPFVREWRMRQKFIFILHIKMLTQAESTRKKPTGGEDVRMGSDVHMWKPLYIECVASYTVFLLDTRRLKVNIHYPHIQRPK